MDAYRWFKGLGRREDADIRLLCFHYAGGSASMFRDWAHLLPGSIEPVSVQLPGRADRFLETPHTSMTALVDELIEVLEPTLDKPFACYGASMGARVSWALAHSLGDRHLPLPRKLYVSSSTAPVLKEVVRGWNEDDDKLVAYMRELGGTPPEVLGDDDLLTALLPILRADLTVLGTHAYRTSSPLKVPLHAFAGRDDEEASPDLMAQWCVETSAGFGMDVIDTGHFLNDVGLQQVIDVISSDLG
ncbi:thioesterase II family protein [Streptomyces olivaceiscleroticus]|uniref:Alpha/beta fold hydrolase n=1 Tax=Streptomyces olivaceiscleroticus TaxID=68245 RepID=A0ABP3L816_9ACTN